MPAAVKTGGVQASVTLAPLLPKFIAAPNHFQKSCGVAIIDSPTWLCTYQDYISVTARSSCRLEMKIPGAGARPLFYCQKMAFRLISLPTPPSPPRHRSILDTRCKLFVRAHNGNHTGGMVQGTACRARHPTTAFQNCVVAFSQEQFQLADMKRFTHLHK